MAVEKISVEEFQKRLKAQDVSVEHLAFICPRCGTVQSIRSLIIAGCAPEKVEKVIGFSCIGRWSNAMGCDWTLGGFFRLHELEILSEDGKTHSHFVPATADQAHALMRSLQTAGSTP